MLFTVATIGRQAGIANLVEKCAVADLERFRGAATVPVMCLKYLENDFPLQPAHGLVGNFLKSNRTFLRNFKIESCSARARPDQR